MQRQNRIVCNTSLNEYCKKHDLSYGCNVFEIKFGQLVLEDLNRAKAIILELMDNKYIQRLDKEQIIDGQLNPKIATAEEIKEQGRALKSKFFNQIKQKDLPNNIKWKKLQKWKKWYDWVPNFILDKFK